MDKDLSLAKKLLWKKLLEKIHSEWNEKYTYYGTLDKIEQQTNFCKALEDDFYKKIAIQRTKKKIIPTWNTLNIFFNQGGFGKKPKQKTLDVIAMYLGYDNFKNFANEVRTETVSPPVTVHAPSPKLESLVEIPSNQNNKYRQKKMRYVIGLVVGIFGLIMIYYVKQPIHLNEDEKDKIRNVLKQVNDLEFELYEQIPDTNMLFQLERYFTSNSPAKNAIESRVKRNKRLNRVLDREISEHNLNVNQIDFLEVQRSRVVITTIEHWKLIWLDVHTKEEVHRYVNTGKQPYVIIRQDTTWLIDENNYKGKAN